jgi:hypothetical protein
MKLEIIILSKMRQTQKDKCCIFLSLVELGIKKQIVKVDRGLFGERNKTSGQETREVNEEVNMIKLHYTYV